MDHVSFAMGPSSRDWAMYPLKHELCQFGPIGTDNPKVWGGPLSPGIGSLRSRMYPFGLKPLPRQGWALRPVMVPIRPEMGPIMLDLGPLRP